MFPKSNKFGFKVYSQPIMIVSHVHDPFREPKHPTTITLINPTFPMQNNKKLSVLKQKQLPQLLQRRQCFKRSPWILINQKHQSQIQKIAISNRLLFVKNISVLNKYQCKRHFHKYQVFTFFRIQDLCSKPAIFPTSWRFKISDGKVEANEIFFHFDFQHHEEQKTQSYQGPYNQTTIQST